ncbi:MAG: MerR family transcriptional regulator [Clostridiales bacterium]|nr:MerR family transcriptional regulator [Clostridiales bacterium]
MYTIGQVSEMFGLPVSTLRYYDKEGLFPDLQRTSGIRKFSDRELETLRVIECLKKSGLEIKDIKQFMKWCGQGSNTYPQRKELFEKQVASVESEMERMKNVLALLKYKCWYYEQAIQDGNEDRLKTMKPEDMPEEIRLAYESAHKR